MADPLRTFLTLSLILAVTVPVRAQGQPASEPAADAPAAAVQPTVTETASPAAPEVAEAPPTSEAKEEPFFIGGTVIYENSLGRGTFLSAGPNQRPWWNMWFRLEPFYRVHGVDGLRLALRFDFSVNVVENADSSNTRPNQLQPGDLKLIASWADIATWEPIGFGLSASVALSFPTSWASRLTTKVLGMSGGFTTAIAPLDWLEIHYRFGVTKNFNQYTHAVVDTDDFASPPVSRAGGAEALAESLLATGSAATSHLIDNELGATFTLFDVVSFGITWEMLHAFSYGNYPLDKWSSPYATAGRGQTDIMIGTLEVGWEVFDYFSLALGTVVEQAPKSADNQDFRFPWWDTTNGASNRQLFYLDAIGSF